MRNWKAVPGEWFPVRAMVLSEGTGVDDTGLGELGRWEGGLGAWDAALHDGGGKNPGCDGAALARLNFHQVSSVIPKGVPLFRLDKKRALEIDPGGMQAPAVWKDVRTCTGETISAGVAWGVADSPYDTGIIFTAGGPVSAAQCERILRVQVTRGMERRGSGRWTFHTAIATSEPDPGDPDRPDKWRAATAVSWFLDEYAFGMYRSVLDPL
jgi:pyruvoyl-dependent arginine decarboxylase (PvlArgDC)